MNIKQKIILLLGIILFVAMGVYPPWLSRMITSASSDIEAGPYALITSSQNFGKHKDDGLNLKYIDLYRLGVQWIMVVVVTGGLLLILKDNK